MAAPLAPALLRPRHPRGPRCWPQGGAAPPTQHPKQVLDPTLHGWKGQGTEGAGGVTLLHTGCPQQPLWCGRAVPASAQPHSQHFHPCFCRAYTNTPLCHGRKGHTQGHTARGGDSPRCPPCPQMVPCPHDPIEEGGRAARLRRFLPARGVPAPSPKPHWWSHSVTGSPEDPILGVLPAVAPQPPHPPSLAALPGQMAAPWQPARLHLRLRTRGPRGAAGNRTLRAGPLGGGNTHHHTGQAAAAPAPYRFGVPQRVAPSAPAGPSGMRGGIRVAWGALAPRDPAPRASASPVLGCV